MSTAVERRHAFPSFAVHADFLRVRDILQRGTRPVSNRVRVDARQHVLPLVICAHRVADSNGRSSAAHKTTAPPSRSPIVGAGSVLGMAPLPSRGRSRSNAFNTHAVAAVQRGAVTGTDGVVRLDGDAVCGNVLHPCHPAEGARHYRSSRCCEAKHHSMVSASIERTVVAVVAHRFDAASLRRVAEAGWAAAAQDRAQMPKLRGTLAQMEARAAGTREMIADARGASDVQEARALQRQLDEIKRHMQVVQEELNALERTRGELATMMASERERILALATDLPALLARATPEQLRTLMRVLLNAVHVRFQGKTRLEIGLQYPTGMVEWHTVTTQTIRARQPELVYVLGRTADGASPMEIARELNTRRGADRWRCAWSADRVAGLLLQSGREAPLVLRTRSGRRCAVPRPGTKRRAGWTIAELAAHVGESADLIWELALRGKFGQATYERETLRVAPTPLILHRKLPGYARRCVAAASGWKLADTLLIADVARQAGRDPGFAERKALSGRGMRRDRVQRKYAHRADLNR